MLWREGKHMSLGGLEPTAQDVARPILCCLTSFYLSNHLDAEVGQLERGMEVGRGNRL